MMIRYVMAAFVVVLACSLALAAPAPVAQYQFDETGADRLTDSVGESHGTLSGATGIVEGGVSGGCLRLTRDEGSYASLGSGFAFEDQDFSVATWVWTPADYVEDESVVLSRHLGGVVAGYVLFVNTTSIYGSPGTASFYYSGTCITSTTTVTDGNWHHLAAVYRREGMCELYVDGRLEATGETTPMVVAEAPLIIGGYQVGEAPKGTFPGALDRLTFCASAVTAEDIAALMQH